MALFGLFSGKPERITNVQDPKWVKSSSGRFHLLMQMDPFTDVPKGTAGVYIIWHGGVRPEWVYFGESNDIASALDQAQDNTDISEYEINGRLYASWSPVKENLRKGVLLYLNTNVDFLVPNPQAPAEETDKILPVPVSMPGASS